MSTASKSCIPSPHPLKKNLVAMDSTSRPLKLYLLDTGNWEGDENSSGRRLLEIIQYIGRKKDYLEIV